MFDAQAYGKLEQGNAPFPAVHPTKVELLRWRYYGAGGAFPRYWHHGALVGNKVMRSWASLLQYTVEYLG